MEIKILIFLFIISLIINIIFGILIYNLIYKIIIKYENYIIEIKRKFEEGYRIMKQIDIKKSFSDTNGAFENDDEVGMVYNKIKEIIVMLDNEINENK